jgi:hypothetical protein
MYDNLNTEEQHELLNSLQKYEHLFNGTLGDFNMTLISLQLQDQESKPVHACPYTVPRALEQQLRREIARLLDIGIQKKIIILNWHSKPLLSPERK